MEKTSFSYQENDVKNEYLINIQANKDHEQISNERMVRNYGSVYTPPELATFLTSWAIQRPEDKILDIGIGEGAFIFAAYDRLRALGALATQASHQLFGAEIDTLTFNRFSEAAKNRNTNINFSHLQNANFFDLNFPPVDAIVGNPPYVRRTYLENVDDIRKSVIKANLAINEVNMTRMTDLYIYFLMQALSFLKPGGKLAAITSDPWLNMSYGNEFKRYLQQHFKIETLVSLDKRVFENAEVKSVLILATKKEFVDLNWYVHFVRVKNDFSIDRLQQSLSNLDKEQHTDVVYSKIKSSDLKAFAPWSVHFKAPEVYEELEAHSLMTHIENIAETRIGVQTLAKEFFVLEQDQIEALGIEKEFLEPLAQSIRYISKPIIEPTMITRFHLFYCAKSKEELKGTYALEYILHGENCEVPVRGKGFDVIGYHNKERIKRANRKRWYDLKSSLQRRGRASILIPRLVYRTFTVVWNKAGYVPGELFIEFLPLGDADIEVYLAVLTSSISEIMLRTHAQIYGGGTYNISPGQIKKVPILNVGLLTIQQKEYLRQAYAQYLSDKTQNRLLIDEVVYGILRFDGSKQQKLKEVLNDLLSLSAALKK